MPTVPTLVISEVLLPQCNIMAAFVHSHSILFSDVSPGLTTYNNYNVTQFTVYTVWSLPADPLRLLHKVSNCQHTKITSHKLQCTLRSFPADPLRLLHKVSNCQHNTITMSHNLQCTLRSFPADPLTLLHKVYNCQHTTITMSHNLQCTQYGHFLLTRSDSYPKCPTVNIQQYIVNSYCLTARCTITLFKSITNYECRFSAE
jgi:hypothetical protein